jgi:hypothetical protein
MDDIEAEKAQAKKGPDCAFVGIYKALQKPDADDLRDALARPEISSTVISRVLGKQGQRVQSQTVGRHRRGECSCERI